MLLVTHTRYCGLRSQALECIAQYTKVPPPTNATAIVTGAESELTNVFLQHVAIVAYHKRVAENPTLAATAPSVAAAASPRYVLTSSPAWITRVKVMWSLDNSTYSELTTDVRLQGPDDHYKIILGESPVLTKFIKIVPLSWSGPAPAVRLQLSAVQDTKLMLKDKVLSPRSLQSSAALTVGTERVIGMLTSLQSATTILIKALEHLFRLDELRKAKKQEEVRKVNSYRGTIVTFAMGTHSYHCQW